MDCRQVGSTILYENNDDAKAQTENSLHYKRTKHVNIAYHYTRQIVNEDVVILMKINTGN